VRIAAGMMLAVMAFWTPFFVFEAAASSLQEADTDGDGLSDEKEMGIYATDPANADTDGDGYADGDEIRNGYSPRHGGGMRLLRADSDDDYLVDAWEIALGTGILNPDSDGDLYLDGTEVAAGYDPLDAGPSKKMAKRIVVDTKARRLTYSFGDVALGDVLVAIGKPATPTPTGEFSVLAKVPTKHYRGPTRDYPNTKWNLRFTSKHGLGYYIHGAYWHNNWGGTVSGGCVNVRYEDMEPLYWFAQLGTTVRIN